MGQWADLITNEIQPKIDAIATLETDITTVKNAIDGLGTFTEYPVNDASPTPSESDFLAMTDTIFGSSTSDNPYRAAVAESWWIAFDDTEKNAQLKNHTGYWQNWLKENETKFTDGKSMLNAKKAELQALEDAL